MKTREDFEQPAGGREIILYLLSQNLLLLVKPDLQVLALLEVCHCDHVPLIGEDSVELDMPVIKATN